MKISALLLVLAVALTAAGQPEIGSDSVPREMPPVAPLNVDSDKIGSMVDYVMALQEKDDNQAAELLVNVLKYDPDAEMPLLMLLKRSSNPEVLNKVKPRLVELARANPGALKLNLAVLLFANSDVPPRELAAMGQGAIKSVTDPEKLSAQNQAVLAKLAEITAGLLAREKRYGEAEAIFEQLIGFEAVRRDIQFLQAAARFYSTMVETTEPDGEKLALYKQRQAQLLELTGKYFKNPDSLALTLQTADIYQQLGAYPQAIKLIEYQLLKMPNNSQLQERLGNLFYLTGDFKSSLRLRRELARRYPEIQNFQNAYAETLLYTGNINDAVTELEAINKSHPRDMYFRYMLGSAYFYARRYRDAIGCLEDFKNFSSLRMLVTSYTNLGEFDEALRLMKEAETSTRKDFVLDVNFYFMYLIIGEKSKREDLVRQCAATIKEKFGWTSPEIANAVGYTYADMGIELELAEELIRLALAAEPDNMAILDSMAWVLYRRGDFKGARHYIEKSIIAAGDGLDAVVADHAGDIYSGLGRPDRAVRYWKKALRTRGDDIDPAGIRKKIKAAEDEMFFYE